MIRFTASVAPLLLCTLLLIPACSGDTSPVEPPPPPPPGTIGPQGGSFTSSDGAVQITVPAGAVSSSVVLSVQENPTAAADANVGAAWTFGPSGTQFANPVTLRLRYPEQAFEPGTDVSSLQLARLEDGVWVPRGENVTVNAATRELTGQVRSFSTWAIWSDPCTPLRLEPLVRTGSGALGRSSCRFQAPGVARYTRYLEFTTSQQTALEVDWSAGFPFVAGLKEATSNPSQGTVWGSTTGTPQAPVVHRYIIPAGVRQVYISSADTLQTGNFTYTTRTRTTAELTSGGGCQRGLVFMMPGTSVTDTRLSVPDGDCQTTIQFNPDPRWIGRPLVIERYAAKLVAGRTYTVSATVTGTSQGVALTVFRDNAVVAQRLPSGGPITPITITPASDGYYILEVSAANDLENNGPLPVVPYTLSLSQ